MHYLAYEAHSRMMKPVRSWAQLALPAFMPTGMGRSVPLRNLRAAYELIARAGLSHERPAFGIATVKVGNRDLVVRERKSTRLNSSHQIISYAVFCLKKKKNHIR